MLASAHIPRLGNPVFLKTKKNQLASISLQSFRCGVSLIALIPALLAASQVWWVLASLQ